MQLQIKYYSSTYSWLCFRHAVQEAMRGENIETDVDNFDTEYYLGTAYCELCSIERSLEENALEGWYKKYVEFTEKLHLKRPTEEELREEATKLRSKRKR